MWHGHRAPEEGCGHVIFPVTPQLALAGRGVCVGGGLGNQINTNMCYFRLQAAVWQGLSAPLQPQCGRRWVGSPLPSVLWGGSRDGGLSPAAAAVEFLWLHSLRLYTGRHLAVAAPGAPLPPGVRRDGAA